MNYEFEWPEIFITGKRPKDYSKKQACAEGLMGWGICHAGGMPPEKFGEGMVEIGTILGISATGANLMKYSKEVLQTT